QPVDLGPEKRVAVVQLSDGPEGLTRRHNVGGGQLTQQGRRRRRLRRVLRRRRSVRSGLRGVLGRERRCQPPPEQPCYKGEQGCSFRTADRRPPHPGPPGTRRAIPPCPRPRDRKSTRLNSSHEWISDAVFCFVK